MTLQSQRALFVGRFQPFHLGHQEAILQILKDHEEVIIVIGSAQNSHDVNNPFTAGERITMIREALNTLGVDAARYYLIPIPDSSMHAIWTSQVIAYCPEFSVVFSNEPLTRCLFKEAGQEVRSIPLLKRTIYCATEIRERMLKDGAWQHLVPASVVKVIERIHGIQRLKDLIKSDAPFHPNH
jgi:nicotinamide-nucleotide adenylyltransferase